jgi:hypothetical protein
MRMHHAHVLLRQRLLLYLLLPALQCMRLLVL